MGVERIDIYEKGLSPYKLAHLCKECFAMVRALVTRNRSA